MLSFTLLTLLVFILSALLIFTKERAKVGFLFSILVILIFYTPNLYFFLGGESYRHFDEESLGAYIDYSNVVMFLYILTYISVYAFKSNIKTYEINFRSTFFVKLYFYPVFVFVVMYYLYFSSKFPVVNLLLYGELLERPDLTGSIPFFFMMSTIAFVVMPSMYFYYFSIFNKFQHALINAAMVVMFVMAGHKGVVVFYFLFLWLYVFNAKVDLKIAFLFVLSLMIYMLTKGITELNADVVEYLMSSPFRRMFVTQGACFLHRLDMLAEGYSYMQADPRGIKFDVFSHMYNTNVVGSCPTFVTGDLMVKYGFASSLVFFVLISSIILSISKSAFYVRTNKRLLLYWTIYFCIYIIVMSGIETSNQIRISFALFNLALIYFLSKVSVTGIVR